MNLKDYCVQFKRNLAVMSYVREDTTQDNACRALEFLFDKRRTALKSPKDIEELILKAAEITTGGIAVRGGILRRGEDVENIPEMWEWFIKTLHWMLTVQCFDVEEVAAFSEYVINTVGRFFSTGCGEISTLISTYVFMRYDLPCVMYTSREQYCRVCERSSVPSVEAMKHFLADSELENFMAYYISICPSRNSVFTSHFEKQSDKEYVCFPVGILRPEWCVSFRRSIEELYEKNGDVCILFDCSALSAISLEGADVLNELKSAGKSFVLINLNFDCIVLLRAAGLEAYFDRECSIPKIDLSGCAIISQGANGIIYRVSDDVVSKTFKAEPNYNDLVRERLSLKNALISGVPAPFSLGYAEYNGKIAVLMEFINSASLMKMLSADPNSDEYIPQYARLIKELHNIRSEKKLKLFRRNAFGKEILTKADRVDSVLLDEYRGKARKIITAIDEPECLVHGDIQPNNILLSDDGLLFIDFDTFSTGKASYDLGALFRTLLDNIGDSEVVMNDFLGISYADCREIWEHFVSEYYMDESDEFIQKKVLEAQIIGDVLNIAKMIKRKKSPERLRSASAVLEQCIDNYEKSFL